MIKKIFFKKEAFTLIEVMTALVIFIIFLLPLLNNFVSRISLMLDNKLHEQTVLEAKQIIEEYKNGDETILVSNSKMDELEINNNIFQKEVIINQKDDNFFEIIVKLTNENKNIDVALKNKIKKNE